MHALLPQDCLLCGAPSGNAWACAPCRAELPRLGPACPHCALPTPGGEPCGACLAHPPAVMRTVTAFRYTFPVDRLIQSFKYDGQLAVGEALAEELAQRLDLLDRPDRLLPVPLHPTRLKERGFNQTAVLARALSRRLGVPVTDGVCTRHRDTPPQADLARKLRERNVKDAFVCGTGLAGLRVALVDDVMTSGATLNALARGILKAGAASVEAWVVARAARD